VNKIKYYLFLIFLSFFFINYSYSEIIKFSVGTWDGEVKKEKAHGKGILTFENGAVYEGKMYKNKIHGKGKLTLQNGEVYEGKWKKGKLKIKINKKTRKIVELGTKGRYFWERHEVRGQGIVSSDWFSAEEKSGSYVLTSAGQKKMKEATRKKQLNEGSGGSSGSGC